MELFILTEMVAWVKWPMQLLMYIAYNNNKSNTNNNSSKEGRKCFI